MKEKERYTHVQDNSKKPTKIKKKTIRYEGKNYGMSRKKRERCTYIQDTKKNNKIEEKTIRNEGNNYEISRKKRDIHIYIRRKKRTRNS